MTEFLLAFVHSMPYRAIPHHLQIKTVLQYTFDIVSSDSAGGYWMFLLTKLMHGAEITCIKMRSLYDPFRYIQYQLGRSSAVMIGVKLCRQNKFITVSCSQGIEFADIEVFKPRLYCFCLSHISILS